MVNIGNNTHKSLSLDGQKNFQTPKWVIPLMVGSWFLGLLLLFWMYSYTKVTIWEVIKYYVFFAVIFTLIPYKWVVKIIPVDYYFMLFVNILGFGPLFTGIFFCANFMFSNHPTTHTKMIVQVEYGEGFESRHTIIELEGKALEKFPKFRTFDPATRTEILNSYAFTYTLADGLFGYKVLKDYAFIRNEN